MPRVLSGSNDAESTLVLLSGRIFLRTCLRPPKHQANTISLAGLRAGGKPVATFPENALKLTRPRRAARPCQGSVSRIRYKRTAPEALLLRLFPGLSMQSGRPSPNEGRVAIDYRGRIFTGTYSARAGTITVTTLLGSKTTRIGARSGKAVN